MVCASKTQKTTGWYVLMWLAGDEDDDIRRDIMKKIEDNNAVTTDTMQVYAHVHPQIRRA